MPRKSNASLATPPTTFGGGPGERNLLSRYLGMLKHYPPLDIEAEKELLQAYYDRGDGAAGRRLVTSNLRLVVRMAMKYSRNRSEILDLIQEGNVGLLEALDRFDTSRDVRFATYARHWIRAMMLKYLLDNHRLVRLGSTRAGRKLFFRLRKERREMERLGLTPTAEGLAARLEVPVEEVRTIDSHLCNPETSIDAPTGGDEEARPLSEVLPDDGQSSPEVGAARAQVRIFVAEKVERFGKTIDDERDRAIWERRTVSDDPETLATLGEEYGVSKERIRQLEARMKARLRGWMEEELGEEVDGLLALEEDLQRFVGSQ